MGIENNFEKLDDLDLQEVPGGVIVDDGDGQKYWLIRQNGTVIAPAPSKEKAIEFRPPLWQGASLVRRIGSSRIHPDQARAIKSPLVPGF